ncbi:MAG: DUF2070 family protein [Archaeoglobaceae archaeon]
MIDNHSMERFYSKMFTTPEKRISVTIGLVTITLASIINGITSEVFFAQRYFFIGLFVIICFLISRRYIGLAFNNRRVFFLSLIILISIEVFDFIAIHILHKFYLIVVAPSAATALITITLYFTSKASERRVLFTSAIIFMAVYPVSQLYSFQTSHRFLAYILIVAAGIILSFLFIRFMDRDFKTFNVKDLLKSFILYWLTTNTQYFEKEIAKSGFEQTGWTKCLSIEDAKLISPSFHPGPMRDIGGASLVSKVLEKFPNSMYLHSASKHENNPVSGEDVQKILDSVKCSGKELVAHYPYEVTGDRFNLRVFPFNEVKLLIFSGKDVIDDIPSKMNQKAEQYLGEVMLVDGHNAYRENYDLSDEDVLEIEQLLKKAADTRTEECDVQYFFYNQEIDNKNLEHTAILFLKYGDDTCGSSIHGILSLDGNNIDRDFKEELEDYGRENGISLTVTTTDNHSRTGVSPKVGYRPVGDKQDRQRVYAFIEEALEKMNFKKGDLSYSRNEVTVRVMGRQFFEDAERAFNELGGKALYLLLAVVLFQLLLTLVLGMRIL